MGSAYSRLPGRWSGILSIASLWRGEDHVLSVKSDRIQEFYKRFYFRDIQAIVVTAVPRWRVSAAEATAGVTLVLTGLLAHLWGARIEPWIWLLLVALAAAWVYGSATRSCICRIYTAVSREELPSVYRLAAARKLLAELEPRIAEVQGSLGDWAEAADVWPLGPAAPSKTGKREPVRGRSRTVASLIFVAAVLVDALATAYDLTHPAQAMAWLLNGIALLEVVSAIWMFVEYQRGILRGAMQKLAVVTLVFIGTAFYVQNVSVAVTTRLGVPANPALAALEPASTFIRQVYAGGCLIFGIAGVVLSFSREEKGA